VPSTPPDGDPAPDDGRLPGPALTEVGAQPFGVYVHVPFCTGALRLLRFQHLHPQRAGRWRGPGVVPPIAPRSTGRSSLRPGCWREERERPARRDGVRSVAGRRRCLTVPETWPPILRGGSAAHFGPRPGRGGHHRGQSRLASPSASLAAAAGRQGSRASRFGMQSAMGPARAACSWTARTTRCGVGRRGRRGRERPGSTRSAST
jgi:hypothetical protein